MYGAALGFIVLMTVLEDPKTKLTYCHPVRYIKGFLSLNIWVPIATLSYSIYIFHKSIIVFYILGILDIQPFEGGCDELIKVGIVAILKLFVLTTLVAILWTMPLFVFIEKAAIDARVVFTNKLKK